MSYTICRECWKVDFVYGGLKLCVQCYFNLRENMYITNKLAEEHLKRMKGNKQMTHVSQEEFNKFKERYQKDMDALSKAISILNTNDKTEEAE